MKTKLTLSVDPKIAEQAHALAKRRNRSVSALFSDYVHRQEAVQKKQRVDIMSEVGSLAGYDIDDSKEAIRELYAKKYLD